MATRTRNSLAAARQPLSMGIRWMITRDHQTVLDIERASFSDPWTADELTGCIRQRNVIGMVGERGDSVISYMVYELHKSKLVVLNIAVHPDCRGRSVGTQMLSKLKSKLSSHRRTQIQLDISEVNTAGQLFLRANRFLAVDVLRGHFEDGRRDAYRFAYEIDTADAEDDCDGR